MGCPGRWRASASRKAFHSASVGGRKRPVSSFTAMGLSRTGMPASSRPSAAASSSPTFTPAIITYSSVTRPRAAACSRTASTSSSSGWPRSTGMSAAPLLRDGGVERHAEPELVPLGGVAPDHGDDAGGGDGDALPVDAAAGRVAEHVGRLEHRLVVVEGLPLPHEDRAGDGQLAVARAPPATAPPSPRARGCG